MAEKGFGVKEVNLIGASGTPTITSPNNLNLNAVNVAISTNVSIGGTLSVTGNVSIGGTLTYEDVTNIDSVGIITAQSDVHVGAGLSVVGVSTFSGTIYASSGLVGNATKITLTSSTSNSSLPVLFSTGVIGSSGADTLINSSKLTFNPSSGTLAATIFSGSGASLTNLPVSNSDIQVAYTVTANGSSAYRFAGNGVVSTADNPDLYLIRGKKYRFINNSGGSHPFQIRESSGGSAYSTGVTNNGAASGNIDFAPTYDSPAQLVYQCTSHGGMVGNIYITGGNGTHKIVADANPVMEFDRGSANNTNLNLKYNGTLTGQLSVANEEVQLSTVGSNTDIAFYIQGTKKGYWKDSGELWFGSNNTYIKANQIRFGEAGAAYIDQYTTGQDINFRTSVSSALDTTGMTLKSSGNLAFASGKGIDFSATGGPASGTGGSEILSDYEQGTFSPAWFDDGGTFVSSYSVQYGQYTKIGNVVYFCFGLRIGSFARTPNSGQACRVGNLPYVSRVVGDDQEPVFNLYARLWGSGTPPETAWLRQSSGGSGSNHVEFYMDESQTGNDHILTGADFDTSSTCRVVVSGFYFTS